MRAFCLSIHSTYQCAHSGACCTAGWPIAIESGGLKTRIPVTAEGACVFFDRDGGRLCAIQRDAGVEAMPTACRNFPRITLRDPRGIFVTLSHFCPTAARMLLTAEEIAIVEAPASISLGGHAEGLDATGVMPPLLRPGMLMDLEGYTAWEQAAIGVLNDRRYAPHEAVEIIAAATRDAGEWSPGRTTLASTIVAAFERARAAHRSADTREHPSFEHALKAFLSAHLFASWAAYEGEGLQAVVETVRTALDLVGTAFATDNEFIDSVRAADLRLRHHISGTPLTPDPFHLTPDP
jgi:hypothetical protein